MREHVPNNLSSSIRPGEHTETTLLSSYRTFGQTASRIFAPAPPVCRLISSMDLQSAPGVGCCSGLPPAPSQPQGPTAGTGLVVVAGTWAENVGNIGGCNVAGYDTMIRDFG